VPKGAFSPEGLDKKRALSRALFLLEMDEKHSHNTTDDEHKPSRVWKAFAALLIVLCFFILVGWLFLLGRGFLILIDWLWG
jgi:hypothetical protein